MKSSFKTLIDSFELTQYAIFNHSIEMTLFFHILNLAEVDSF